MSVDRVATPSQLTDSYAEHAEHELTQKSLPPVDISPVRFARHERKAIL